MDKLNLSSQISQDKNYFSNEKSARSKRLKIIIVGILSLLGFISLIFAGYTYLRSQRPISPTGEKLPPEVKQETELFERFPNSSNKGNIAIDKNFIWVANGAGLIRYNKKTGEQKIFTESDGLLGNETRQVLKYKDELWITSQSRGISILNTKNNSWRYFTTANGLVNDGNLIMKLDGDILWLATFDGFGRYDFKTGKWTNWKEGDGVRFAGVEDFVFNDDFVWIYVTPNAYTKGGVLRLDKRSLTWQDLQFNNQIFSERQLWHSPDLYLDNNYLYALADKKIYRQNIISGQWEVFDKNEENLIKFHIGSEKYGNKYWSFNKEGKIEIADVQSNSRELIDTNLLNQYCPKIRHIFNFSGMNGYEKEFNFDGNILWFGCRQGFIQYDLNNKSWSYKETKSNYPAEIYNILTVKNGELLVDSNLGLGLVKPEKQEWIFIKSLETENSQWDSAIWKGDYIYFVEILEAFSMGPPSKPPRLWKYDTISKIVSQIEIPDGLSLGELVDLDINTNLWINSGNKFQEFNPASGEVISYEPKIELGKYLSIKDVVKRDNDIWFVSNLGLGKLDLVTKNFEIIGNPPGIKFPEWGLDHLVIAGEKVWTDASDNPGDGLYIYDLVSKKWEHLTQANSGLKFDWVKNLIGTNDYLLISSFGKVDFNQRKRGDASVITTAGTYIYERYGLNIHDIKNNAWKFFTSEDGMLDGEIESIYIDGDNVWFSNAENGIWKLNIEKLI